MTYKPSNSQNTFVDTSPFLPEDAHQQTLKLTDTLRSYSSGINSREIGQYYLNEINTGSSLYSSTPQKNRSVFRKVVDFGALPNAGTKSVPHGITFTNSFQIIKLICVGNNPNAIDPTPYAIAIPDMNSTLTITTINIVITTTVDYSAYTNTAVIVEYSKA